MRTISLVSERMAGLAKSVVMIGVAVFGWGQVASATETEVKAGPTIDKVETLKVDVKSIVKSINKVNASTLAGLPIAPLAKAPAIAAVQAPTYWYRLNAARTHTVGTVAFTGIKTAVIAMQDCKDAPTQPICLFGSTNPSLPDNTPIGTPAPENRILQDN